MTMTMQTQALKPVHQPHPSPLPSIWQSLTCTSTSASSSPLLTHPPPQAPPPPYETAIIGTGITGALTAYHTLLSSPHTRLALLDARTACSGATGRNGGHTKAASYRSYAAHVHAWGTAEALRVARLEYANLRATHALARELGVEKECESWEGNTVDAVYDRETFEEGKRAWGMLRGDASAEERAEGGLAWCRVLGAGEAAERFGVTGEVEVVAGEGGGARKEKLVGAFEYAAGSIHAYRFTMAVLAKCIEMGAHVYEHTAVQAIEPIVAPSSSPSADPSAPRFTLKTAQSSIAAHTVVVATNAYTASLLPELQTAIVPLRGQVTAQCAVAKQTLAPLRNTYSFIYKGGYEYMIPRTLSPAETLSEQDGSGVKTNTHEHAQQQIIIGGGLARLPNAGASEYGTVNDSALNPTISRYLSACLPAYFGLAPVDLAVQAEWTGIMGATRDGVPFVGAVPRLKGVWVAAGFYGHGMVLCVKSAEALVRMIRGESVEWLPGCFGIEGRLGGGRFEGRMDLGGCGVGSGEGGEESEG